MAASNGLLAFIRVFRRVSISVTVREDMLHSDTPICLHVCFAYIQTTKFPAHAAPVLAFSFDGSFAIIPMT